MLLFLSSWKGLGSHGCTLSRWESYKAFLSKPELFFCSSLITRLSIRWKLEGNLEGEVFPPHLKSQLPELVLIPQVALGRVFSAVALVS